MILHFSHIGLTDGLTFMIPFGDWVPARRLWLPLRPPLPPRGEALVRVRNRRLRAEPLILATPRAAAARAPRLGGATVGGAPARSAAGPEQRPRRSLQGFQPGRASSSGSRSGVAAAGPRQGVSTRGPSPVIATVYSKCAAGEPSWEKIAQPSPPTRTAARPAVIIGSTASTMPSSSSGPLPGKP